jgi:hypothetical protein
VKYQVPFRVIVDKPLAGVAMLVQKGRDELLRPTTSSEAKLVFDFDVTVDLNGDNPNFLGKFAQGPKDARFVYVNSGAYAGQAVTCWSRRAKLSLMSIGKKKLRDVIDDDTKCVETTMPGVGRDGGPTCASVKGIEWRVAKR